MTHIIVFSLGQWVKSDINILKNKLFDLAIDSNRPARRVEEVWDWFKGYLPQLRLEVLPDETSSSLQLETIREAFNTQYGVEIGEEEFLEGFNEMSIMTQETMASIECHVNALIADPTGSIVLLVSHTNYPHLRSLLTQLQQFSPRTFTHMTVLGSQESRAPNAKVFIATSMHMQTIEHPDTLRAAMPQLPIPGEKEILSFLETVTELEDYPTLVYRNPGKAFQHFYQFIAPPPTLPPVACTVVLSLGDIILEDRNKTFESFLRIMQLEYTGTRQSLVSILTRMVTDEERPRGVIASFKLGGISKQDFITVMINKIFAATGVTLDSAQFEKAWCAKNQSFEQMKSALMALCVAQKEWRALGIEIVLVSYTNPLDMAGFVKTCQCEDIPMTCVNGVLTTLSDMNVLLSYHCRLMKRQMIDSIIPEGADNRSLPTLFGSQKPTLSDVIYVSTALRNPNNHELNSIAACGVYMIDGWDRSYESLILRIGMRNVIDAPESACCGIS